MVFGIIGFSLPLFRFDLRKHKTFQSLFEKTLRDIETHNPAFYIFAEHEYAFSRNRFSVEHGPFQEAVFAEFAVLVQTRDMFDDGQIVFRLHIPVAAEEYHRFENNIFVVHNASPRFSFLFTGYTIV
jgi:hypothetical protein